MADKDITSFRDYTVPELPGCPLSIVDQAIMETLREFFHRTQYWQEDLTAIDVVAAQTEYELDPSSSNSEIDAVVTVEQDGSELEAGVDYKLDDTKKLLVLNNEPDAASTGGLEVKVALKPRLTATRIPERMFNDWVYQIAAGVKGKLMALPKMKWTDQQMAVFYFDKFESGVAEACWESLRGRTNKTITVRATYAFA